MRFTSVTNFKIVINCGPCERFIGNCLRSVQQQTIPNWEAYVTVDPCGDATFDRALEAAGGDARFRIQNNPVRRYSLLNLIDAIDRSHAQCEDVIVTLDGDDWFARNDALGLIADAYEQHDCWMTYGSWITNVNGPSGKPNGLWPAYPDNTFDFRGGPWLGTAVRTWKKWLWDHLSDHDLRNELGQYFRVSEDQVIMQPLLEMCGTGRARHIPEPIMIYNKLTTYNIPDEITQEGIRNGYLLENRSPYPRLEKKFYRGASVGA